MAYHPIHAAAQTAEDWSPTYIQAASESAAHSVGKHLARAATHGPACFRSGIGFPPARLKDLQAMGINLVAHDPRLNRPRPNPLRPVSPMSCSLISRP